MSTNYYWQGIHNFQFLTLHIGKSSCGWCFSLHVIPEIPIYDLNDWKKLWNNKESVIYDEYDVIISVEEMENIITNRSWPKSIPFKLLTNAEIGPNNLLRERVDGVRCIKHGAGTWDCIIGEFS